MRSALIAGASGAIGRECAKRFAEGGYAVGAHFMRGAERAKQTVDEIRRAGGVARAFEADVTDRGQTVRMIDEFVREYGGIDVFVYAVGANIPEPLLMVREESFDKVVAVNLKGALFCCQQAALKMMRKKAGAILCVSSLSATRPVIGTATYAMTKGGLESMTRVMALELARHGIRANALAPGPVNAGMIDLFSERARDDLLRLSPARRFAEAREVADVAFRLCSDEFAHMTGQTIPLDGGLSII